MPWNTEPGSKRVLIWGAVSPPMPALVYQAAHRTGARSVSRYVAYAVIDALVRDLGLNREQLVASLPSGKGNPKLAPVHRKDTPTGANEEVR